MSGEQRVVVLAGLEPKVLQSGDKGLAQLVVDPDTGALLVDANVTVPAPVVTALPVNPFGTTTTTSPVVVIAANAARKGFSIQNLSTTDTIAVSGTGFAIALPPESLYENHPSMNYLGDISVSSTIAGTLVSGFELVG
jgi:hypothetical protein